MCCMRVPCRTLICASTCAPPQVHREQLTFVDVVLAGCATALESRGKVSESKVPRMSLPRFFATRARLMARPVLPLHAQATKQLVNLLTSPLDTYDVVSVLSLSSYPKARALAALCDTGAAGL